MLYVYTPLRTLEIQVFSDFAGGYKKGAFAWNGLMIKSFHIA